MLYKLYLPNQTSILCHFQQGQKKIRAPRTTKAIHSDSIVATVKVPDGCRQMSLTMTKPKFNVEPVRDPDTFRQRRTKGSMNPKMIMTVSNQTAINFDQSEAELATLRGIETAKGRADKMDAKWSDRAYYHAWKYAQNGKEFMTEDARAALEGKLVPAPENPRAWGGVMRKLAGDGLIERVDYGRVKNVKAHGTPATIWKIK